MRINSLLVDNWSTIFIMYFETLYRVSGQVVGFSLPAVVNPVVVERFYTWNDPLTSHLQAQLRLKNKGAYSTELMD